MCELDNKACHLIDQKIEEVINKGDISPSEMKCIKDAYEALYYMKVIDAMESDDGYSDKGRVYGRDGYWQPTSMRRGRGADGRYVSRHSVNDRIIAALEHELNGTESEFERNRIMEEIQRLRERKD